MDNLSKLDYKSLAENLKKNAGKYLIEAPGDFPDDKRLPMFPMTKVSGNSIIILWDEHDEQVWDHFEERDIVEVAAELELELRAIKYVKWRLVESILGLEKDLKEFNVADDKVGEIIYSGFSTLRQLFIEMDRTHNRDKKL